MEEEKVLKIISCKDENYWYSNLIGRIIPYYTIEGGNALIRTDEVSSSTGKKSQSAGYVFDGDYELGVIKEYLDYEFVKI